MSALTLIHAADLHLDAPFRGMSGALLSGQSGRQATREHLARLLGEAGFIALRRLTDLCVRERADALLLAGDVYNSADRSLRARLALRDAFVLLEEHGVRVFMAHGNHDPLSESSAAVPWPENVTVFGPRLESRPLTRPGGETLAVVHGISHSGPRESANLARLFAHPHSAAQDGERVFQVGLLHCALAELSGAHAPYAPCSFGDLAEAPLDYWALGHVHACNVLDKDGKTTVSRPFAAYPGSLQGLHGNESGPHGCLLLTKDEQGAVRAELVPLAPVQWENIRFSLAENEAELADLPALATALLHTLLPFSPRENPAAQNAAGYPPEALLARLTLTGRSDLHQDLRKKGAADDLLDYLNEELDGSGLWLRDLQLDTQPAADLEQIAKRPDLLGESLRRAAELRANPDALAESAALSLAPLFQRQKIRRLLSPPDPEELARLADEAALLCLDLLEGE